MLPLIVVPNQILRAKAKPLSLPLDKAAVKLGKGMAKAIRHYRGVGLAAPQVNEGVRMIAVAAEDTFMLYANPMILDASKELSDLEEGCLSIPGVYGIVARPARVKASYVTLEGAEKTEWLEGFVARVFQHEVDHLEGILFTDRAKRITMGEELMKQYGLA